MSKDGRGSLRNDTTRTLLLRLRDGSQAAFDELFGRLRQSLRRWSRHRLPGWARAFKDTSDIVQDAIARTLLNIHSFQPAHRDALRHYLRTAIRNHVRDEMRRTARRPWTDPLAERDLAAEGDTLGALISAEQDQQLERSLAQLSEKDRELLTARFRTGLSFEQVALVMNLPSANAARMAVNRALIRLGGAMER